MGRILRVALLIVAAIVLLFLAIKIVASFFSLLFYALAIFCIGYAVLYMVRASRSH